MWAVWKVEKKVASKVVLMVYLLAVSRVDAMAVLLAFGSVELSVDAKVGYWVEMWVESMAAPKDRYYEIKNQALYSEE